MHPRIASICTNGLNKFTMAQLSCCGGGQDTRLDCSYVMASKQNSIHPAWSQKGAKRRSFVVLCGTASSHKIQPRNRYNWHSGVNHRSMSFLSLRLRDLFCLLSRICLLWVFRSNCLRGKKHIQRERSKIKGR